MDTEFHYYMTYLIAARAKFPPGDSHIIAHSAQGVDDNHIPVNVVDDKGASLYQNAISQTMDIARPHEDEFIYPIFHFIPGDQNAPSAARKDGLKDPMVTTPNSELANQMIDAALGSGNLYRIGVSAHGYVDTWAHQNFVGKRSSFNEFSEGIFAKFTEFLAVGHARANHFPDWPGLVWQDTRLANPTIVNVDRFMDAAAHLFKKFASHVDVSRTAGDLDTEAAVLVGDLRQDIGPRDDSNELRAARIARYQARALQPAYGGAPIPQYFDGKWFGDAFQENHDAVRDAIAGGGGDSVIDAFRQFASDAFADGRRQPVHWHDQNPNVYQSYDWYQFQEAAKEHLNECKGFLLDKGVLS